MKKSILHLSATFLLTANCLWPNFSLAQYSLLTDFNGNDIFTGSYPQYDQNLISDGTFLYGMTANGGPTSKGTLFKIMPNGTGFSKLLDFDGTTNGSEPLGSLIFDGTFLYGMTNKGGTDGLGTLFKIKPDGTGYAQILNFGPQSASDGSSPRGSLVSDGTFLYGMTYSGGINDRGILFKTKPDGTGYAKLLDFESQSGSKGSYPTGSPIFDGTFLYGMTNSGGTNGYGTIFKIKSDGTDYAQILDFDATINGSYPNGSLISDGTSLFGMTYSGGTNDFGTLFKIMPDGTGYSNLLDFGGTADGKYPYGSLISVGGSLYGMTNSGGANDLGTLFKIMSNGTGYSKMLDFAGAANGSSPFGSLISDGTFLYGMTYTGGTNDSGTLLKIMPNGSGYTKLFDFAGAANGGWPCGSLISDGTFLYGMTTIGGANGFGTLFKIKTNGTGYSKLINFNGLANGKAPNGSLIFDGTFLYGMTREGGTNNFGTVFKIKPDGTGYYKILDFDGTIGGWPQGSLVFDGTFLYGMPTHGGIGTCQVGCGTIFKIKPDGTGYSTLHNFDGPPNGNYPTGTLIFDGTFLYGMTKEGGISTSCGSYGCGTIFKIKPDGTGYSTLLNFTGINGSSPLGSLIFIGQFLYGMTTYGGMSGVNGHGTLFKIMPDGTSYGQLLDFDTLSSGILPYGSLISDGTFLYGTTYQGGINDFGTIFKIKPDGTGYVKLLDFNGIPTGSYPPDGPISVGPFLYGMTIQGGSVNMGTVFKYCPPSIFTHSLTICAGENVMVGNNTYTVSGTYLDTLIAASTCDSIVTTNLTVLPNSSTTQTVTACGSYTWNNAIYTTNGTYLDTIPNAVGCDSIMTLNLSINNGSTSTQTVSACASYTSPSTNYTWTTSGIYNDTIPNFCGSDSLITIYLTINSSSLSTQNISTCTSYTSPSGSYTWTTSGIYSDTIPNFCGSDSLITIYLTINASSSSSETITVCNSYTSPSANYTWTTSGIYNDTIPNFCGSDSVITINLTINGPNSSTQTVTVCNSYTSPSSDYTWTTSGIYNDTIPNICGSDSVITINLTINTVNVTVTNASPTITANAVGNVYQWLDCNNSYVVISGATSQSYSAIANGSYAVSITESGCNDTSECYIINTIGIFDSSKGKKINLYPNPSGGKFTVEGSGEITILNVLGEEVYSAKIVSEISEIDLIKQPNGIYFINIKTDEGTTVQKLVIYN